MILLSRATCTWHDAKARVCNGNENENGREREREREGKKEGGRRARSSSLLRHGRTQRAQDIEFQIEARRCSDVRARGASGARSAVLPSTYCMILLYGTLEKMYNYHRRQCWNGTARKDEKRRECRVARQARVFGSDEAVSQKEKGNKSFNVCRQSDHQSFPPKI